MFIARFLNRPVPKQDRRAFLEDFLLADEEAATRNNFYVSEQNGRRNDATTNLQRLPSPQS